MGRSLERILPAQVASPGLARGVIHLRAGRGQAAKRQIGTPAQERAALERAMTSAAAGLRAPPDPQWLVPALEAIEGGEPAETAFREAMDLLIEDRRPAGDVEFRDQSGELAGFRDWMLAHLTGRRAAEPKDLPEGAILVADELTPARFLEIDWRRVRGVVLTGGNARSHVAMLARGRGVPLLIELAAPLSELKAGDAAILDGEEGRLILRPRAATCGDYDRRIAERAEARADRERTLSQPARTADGTTVAILLNVDDPAVLETVDPAHCDGIGLIRSEFLFHGEGGLPDEERQYRVYRGILHWAGGLPVTIRTLDASADKPVPGLTPEDPSDPLYGLRGLRLALARPEVFRVQLRALARAARHGPLRVMLPMVARPEEFDRARGMLAAEVAALEQSGIAAVMPAFGMMVETPEAARGIAGFDAEFFSLGTNDLARSLVAANEYSADDTVNQAVLQLIERVAAHGRERGVEVSLCGEMAGRPAYIPALLNAGARALSVPPAALAAVKTAVAACRLNDQA